MVEEPLFPPLLELHGMQLRPLRRADAVALHAHLNDSRVTERTSFPAVSLSMAEAMIDRSLRRWAAGEPAKWALTLGDDDRLVGTCGFNDWSPAHRCAELGFDLAPPHWGKGLMRRAVDAVLQWTFHRELVDRVHAYVRVDNARSEGLLQRVGFLREGCLRSFRICRGHPYDFHVYGMLRSEWAAARSGLGLKQESAIPVGRSNPGSGQHC